MIHLTLNSKYPFGKYKGHTVKSMIEDHYDYILWVNRNVNFIKFDFDIAEAFIKRFKGIVYPETIVETIPVLSSKKVKAMNNMLLLVEEVQTYDDEGVPSQADHTDSMFIHPAIIREFENYRCDITEILIDDEYVYAYSKRWDTGYVRISIDRS